MYAYAQATNTTKEPDITEYEVYYIDSADRGTGDSLELNLQGRTLYITSDQEDYGLALDEDAPAIVIQDEYNKTNVKTEFTTVKSAIAHLADPKAQTSEVEYDGKIFAVLNTNGSAAWIVFDSDNGLNTTSGIDGEKAGNVPTDLEESTASATYKVGVNGILQATFEYNAPDYVADNSTVTFDAAVYNNGVYMGQLTSCTGVVKNGEATVTAISSVWAYYGAENLTFSIDNEHFNLMKVRYYDVANDVYLTSADLKDKYTTAVSTGTNNAAVSFQLDTNATENLSYRITQNGGELKAPYAFAANTAINPTGVAKFTADDDGYVDVEISNMNTMSTVYTVDVTAVDGEALSEFGVTGANDKNVTLDVTAPATAAEGSSVTINVLADDALTDAFSYTVALTINGEKTAAKAFDDSTVADFTVNNVQKDVVVEIAEIVATPKFAVEKVVWNDYSIEIHFNMNVDKSTVDDTNFDYRGSATVEDIDCSGKVVTLYFDDTVKVGATDGVKIDNTVEADDGTVTGNTISGTYRGSNGYRVNRADNDAGFTGGTY